MPESDSRVITLREFMDDPNVQTANRSDTFGGMMVSFRWISRTAAVDIFGKHLYSVINNGDVAYYTRAELLNALELTEDDQVLGFYLPGTAPALPKHYGVWKTDPRHPDGGHWYTNEAHTESEAWKLAHHYEYYQIYQPRREHLGLAFEARLLPEDEWR